MSAPKRQQYAMQLADWLVAVILYQTWVHDEGHESRSLNTKHPSYQSGPCIHASCTCHGVHLSKPYSAHSGAIQTSSKIHTTHIPYRTNSLQCLASRLHVPTLCPRRLNPCRSRLPHSAAELCDRPYSPAPSAGPTRRVDKEV